jgi:hypothetical protein
MPPFQRNRRELSEATPCLPKTEQGKHKSAPDEELHTKKSLGTLSPLGSFWKRMFFGNSLFLLSRGKLVGRAGGPFITISSLSLCFKSRGQSSGSVAIWIPIARHQNISNS